MKRKVVIIVGVLAILLGINMQVKALNPADGMFNSAGNKTGQPIGGLATPIVYTRDSTLCLGDSWQAKDNFVSAYDENGNSVPLEKVTVQGSVNTSYESVQKVSYSLAGPGGSWTSHAYITVTNCDQTSLEVKDSTIYTGDTWKPEDNLVKATDKDGNPVGIDKIDVEGSVDTEHAGVYKVWYSLHTGQAGARKVATITVKWDQTSIKGKDTDLIVGDKWEAKDSFISATDRTGKPVGFDKIIVNSNVDTDVASIYGVRYLLSSDVSGSDSDKYFDVKVVVDSDRTSLEVKDSTIYTGDRWIAQDNIVKATDKFGNDLGTSDVTVEGSVDTTKVGSYKVKYTVLNNKKEKISKEATITVETSLKSLKVKDSTIHIGDSWQPEDNFISATDRAGNPISFGEIDVSGSVDTNKEGVYEVQYSAHVGGGISIYEYAKITVKADQTKLEVKDSMLYFGDSWKAEDNLIKATDQDGKDLDIKDVTVEGSVDTNTEGIYKVKYTILNHDKEKISKQATITVKEFDLTSIKVKNSTLYIGDKWNKADNFVEASDAEGKAVDIKDVSVEGEVNTDKVGSYQVTYTILNHKKEKVSEVATISVKADQTSLEVKDSKLFLGYKWQPEDNIVKAIDKDGKELAIKDVTVEGSVDTSKEGINMVKYTILNHKNEKISKEATITVKGTDFTSLEVKNSTLYVDDQWQAQDNFVKATDKDGNALAFKDITVEGSVDTSKEGTNKVKYTILNGADEKITKEATITVKVDQTSLEVKTSTIHVGDTWKPEDNLVKAIDQDGKAIDIKDIVVEGSVDTSDEDYYLVKYTILNHKQEPITETAHITVTANLTTLEVKDSTIYLGDIWKPADNVVKATDADGNPVGIDKIDVEGSVDTSKEGVYKVLYSLNTGQAGRNRYANITVKADETSLEVKNSTVFFGDVWNPADNIAKAIDQDGKPVDVKDITIEGSVDTGKEGINKVKYTILNHVKEKITKEATITVKEFDLTSIKVKNSALYVGDKWNKADNFVEATDAEGRTVDIKDVSVDGKVDTTKAGEYKVNYTILNHKKEKISEVATISVKADQTSLEVKDSTLFFGDEWNVADNFVKATDQDGKAVDIKDIVVEGSVDTSVEGIYKVTYTILNHVKAKITKEATIIVKEFDVTSIEVKNTKLYVGDKWNAADNLVSATNAEGEEVGIKDVIVEGEVNTDKAGDYKVTYTILNHKKEKISEVATITVKADQTTLEVKDSELYFGDTWQPTDNIVKATDQDGKAIDIKDIVVEGDVDTSTEGLYKVKYTVLNHKSEKITKEASITVKGNDLTQLEVKNSQLYTGQKWNPADNVVKAIDKDGQNIDIKDIKLDGEVDTNKAGTYEVAFSILNHKQEKVTATASIVVIADQTSIEVKNSTLYLGDEWQAEDNFVKATDKDGNPVDINDIVVTGNVDTTKEGTYTVSYEIANGAGTKVKKEAVITVKTDQTTLKVKGSVLYLNEEWDAKDNIVKALDKDGKVIDIKDIVIEGKVNTAVANDYTVKFTILNHKKDPVVRATIVKVKEDLTSLEVKDSILYFGDRWQPEDNLVKATDKDGNPLDIGDIKVEGDVDIKTAGEYPVKYTVLNNAKEKITKTATITMKGHDLTYLEVDDSSLYVGDKWNPADNLIKARDKDGNKLGIEDVIVEGSVDTSKAGTYEVIYALLNHNNEKLSNIATITVKEDKTNIVVKDTKIRLNSKWQPANNFVRATDQDGQSLDIKALKVEGKVNTRKVGKYKVNYTLLNHAKKKISKQANITVQKKGSGNGNGNGGNGSDKDGNGKLPKTGYDISILVTLLGLAGVLGLGSLCLNRKEREE